MCARPLTITSRFELLAKISKWITALSYFAFWAVCAASAALLPGRFCKTQSAKFFCGETFKAIAPGSTSLRTTVPAAV
jgi:hypothetical protein